jgi:hypothetical protein
MIKASCRLPRQNNIIRSGPSGALYPWNRRELCQECTSRGKGAFLQDFGVAFRSGKNTGQRF